MVDGLGDVLQLRRQLCAEAPTAFRTLRRRRSTGGDPTVQLGLRCPSGDVSWLVHGLFEEFRSGAHLRGVSATSAALGSREVSDWSARGSTHAIPGVPDGRRRRPDNGLSVVRPTSMCLDHLLLNSCVCLVICINITIECFPVRVRSRAD